MESANYAQKREDMPVCFKSAVWENLRFQVNCVSDGGWALDWIRTVHLLYSTAVGYGQGKNKHAGHGLHFIAHKLCRLPLRSKLWLVLQSDQSKWHLTLCICLGFCCRFLTLSKFKHCVYFHPCYPQGICTTSTAHKNINIHNQCEMRLQLNLSDSQDSHSCSRIKLASSIL